MTMHFQAALSVSELAERATQMMDEACALARLASDLAEFERTTGRKLFVCEGADQAEPEAFQFRSSQADSGIAIENDAQAEPIYTGGFSADAKPQCSHLVTRHSLQLGKATCEQCGDTLSEFAPQPAQEAQAEAASPAPAAPPAAPAPCKAKPEVRHWGKLTLPERQIVKHLERLPKAFTPKDDLRLVELLTGGNKIDAAAAFLEVEPDVALTRWKSFLTEDVIGANGKPTIDGQQRLLNALRYRVETADA